MLYDTVFSYLYVIVLHTVPTPTVTISPSGSIQGAMVDSPQNINCTVSTVSGVESSSVMISWMGPGGKIDATNGRVSIGSVTDEGNNIYTSSLQFDYLMEGDEGLYNCNVMIIGVSREKCLKGQRGQATIFNKYILFHQSFLRSITTIATFLLIALCLLTKYLSKLTFLVHYLCMIDCGFQYYLLEKPDSVS